MITNKALVNDILTHHLNSFGENNLTEILKDYTEEAEVWTPDGPLKGLTAIRMFFAVYFVTIPTGSPFEMKQLTLTENAAYIV